MVINERKFINRLKILFFVQKLAPCRLERTCAHKEVLHKILYPEFRYTGHFLLIYFSTHHRMWAVQPVQLWFESTEPRGLETSLDPNATSLTGRGLGDVQ